VNDDIDLVANAGQGFINRIIDNFVYQVVPFGRKLYLLRVRHALDA